MSTQVRFFLYQRAPQSSVVRPCVCVRASVWERANVGALASMLMHVDELR